MTYRSCRNYLVHHNYSFSETRVGHVDFEHQIDLILLMCVQNFHSYQAHHSCYFLMKYIVCVKAYLAFPYR